MKRFQRIIAPIVLIGALGAILGAQGSTTAGGAPFPAIVNGGRLDRRLVSYAQVVLTNAQVLALNTTAITLIPAQGTGTIIEPLGGVLSYHKGTTTYTIGTGIYLQFFYTSKATGPAASNVVLTTGFLDQSTSKVINFQGVPANEIVSVNTPIVLSNPSGPLTGGSSDDTLTVRLAYRVHNQ